MLCLLTARFWKWKLFRNTPLCLTPMHLVITGQTTVSGLGSCNPNPAACNGLNGGGGCTGAASCECNPGFSGIFCQTSVLLHCKQRHFSSQKWHWKSFSGCFCWSRMVFVWLGYEAGFMRRSTLVLQASGYRIIHGEPHGRSQPFYQLIFVYFEVFSVWKDICSHVFVCFFHSVWVWFVAPFLQGKVSRRVKEALRKNCKRLSYPV